MLTVVPLPLLASDLHRSAVAGDDVAHGEEAQPLPGVEWRALGAR